MLVNRIQKYVFLVLIVVCSIAMGSSKLNNYFISGVMSEPDSYEWNRAIGHISSQGNKGAEFLINQLDRRFENTELFIEHGIEKIGFSGEEVLLNTLTGVDNYHAAIAALMLGRIGSEKAVIPLKMAAQSPDGNLRANAIHALGDIGNADALDRIIHAMNDTLAIVRLNAAWALGQINDSTSIDVLINALEDENFQVRYNASYSLACFRNDAINQILVSSLDDAEDYSKYHIIETIGLIANDNSIDILLELTESSDHYVRGFSFEALGNFRGNFQVANAIKRGLQDNSLFVRMKAELALNTFRGEI